MDNVDTSSVFYYTYLGSSRHILQMSCGRLSTVLSARATGSRGEEGCQAPTALAAMESNSWAK